ncbi:MAG: GNAT family N-acetyltransferase [Alphaproteobacteria bacterium]|nr:GNAT family N-acetyltransferase [Alphaproteobacteria bacterium]
MTIHIETPRLILREWKESDRAPFASINQDPLVMEHLPRALDEKASNKLVDRFQKNIKENGYGLYAIERKEDGEFVGFAGLEKVPFDAHFTPAVEIAWRLDYEYWGQGYGMETGKAILDHAFNKLGMKEVVAFTVHDNARTISLLEKLGMKHDTEGDFDYPGLRKGHPFGRFVLYRAHK